MRNLPPSGPTPKKSVSQKLQIAVSRSSSRPVQRLHPEKRQKTAGLPGVRSLALQGVEDLLDGVGHATASKRSW